MAIQNNPQIANNPRNKEMIEAIKNGDDKKGEELARNLCNTYGDTPQGVIDKARKFFNI